MRVLHTLVKFGDTRIVVKKLPADREIFTTEGIITLQERSLIDVVEVFTQHGREGWWVEKEMLIETLRPCPRKPEPEPEPPRPGFWASLWARITGKQPVPQMKVLK